MSENIGEIIQPGQPAYDLDHWKTWDETDDLVYGMSDFLRQTTEPTAPAVFGRIGRDAHSRVVLSRLDSEF